MDPDQEPEFPENTEWYVVLYTDDSGEEHVSPPLSGDDANERARFMSSSGTHVLSVVTEAHGMQRMKYKALSDAEKAALLKEDNDRHKQERTWWQVAYRYPDSSVTMHSRPLAADEVAGEMEKLTRVGAVECEVQDVPRSKLYCVLYLASERFGTVELLTPAEPRDMAMDRAEGMKRKNGVTVVAVLTAKDAEERQSAMQEVRDVDSEVEETLYATPSDDLHEFPPDDEDDEDEPLSLVGMNAAMEREVAEAIEDPRWRDRQERFQAMEWALGYTRTYWEHAPADTRITAHNVVGYARVFLEFLTGEGESGGVRPRTADSAAISSAPAIPQELLE